MRVLLAIPPALGVFAAVASGRTPPDYDFQFSTVGAVGNAPIRNDDAFYSLVNGRGQVNYWYRISTLEITTGQWMAFLNTFPAASNPHPFGAKHAGGTGEHDLPAPRVQSLEGVGEDTLRRYKPTVDLMVWRHPRTQSDSEYR